MNIFRRKKAVKNAEFEAVRKSVEILLAEYGIEKKYWSVGLIYHSHSTGDKKLEWQIYSGVEDVGFYNAPTGIEVVIGFKKRLEECKSKHIF